MEISVPRGRPVCFERVIVVLVDKRFATNSVQVGGTHFFVVPGAANFFFASESPCSAAF